MDKTEKIKKLIEELNQEMKELSIPEQVIEREIKPFGNASHIILPKEFEKKKAIIIIKK